MVDLMAEIRFKLREIPRIPIEVEKLIPANIVSAGEDKLGSLDIYEGNRTRSCSDFFDISGRVADDQDSQVIVFENSCDKLRRIGYGIKGGKIIVEGDAGSQTGCYMTDGEIVVKGNAGSYTGIEIKKDIYL